MFAAIFETGILALTAPLCALSLVLGVYLLIKSESRNSSLDHTHDDKQ